MKRSLLLFLSCSILSTLQAQFAFSDQSNLLLHTTVSQIPIAITDVNGDNLDDIVRLHNGSDLYVDYQNIDGSYTAYVYGNAHPYSFCLIPGDVDNDDDSELVVGGNFNECSIFEANGTANYTASLLPEGENILTQAASFADVDGDGFLDLFMCHDVAPNYLWMNDGYGNFTHSGNTIIDFELYGPMDEPNSGNYGSVWTDFDRDGDLDFYISKCRAGVNDPSDPRRINQLWENDGNGNYSETAATYGLNSGWQSWVADFQDIDNDGDFDCLIINHDHVAELFENVGGGNYVDITASSGLNITGAITQMAMKDMDNDGFVDIISRFGMYHNNGDKTFTTISPSPLGDCRAFAVGDLNHDGFLDVYKSTGSIDHLYMNDGNANNFFAVHLVGIKSNRDAVGALIELHGDWGVQIREVRAGESYGISHTLTQHFGLGTASSINSLVIHWPSGCIDTYHNVNINEIMLIEEHECANSHLVTSGSTLLCPGESIELSAEAGYTYEWSTGATTQSITVNSSDTYQVTVSNGSTCSSVSAIDVVVDGATCNSLCVYALDLYGNISSDTYETSHHVTSDGSVLLGENVTFEGGHHIELRAGFEVATGAEFLGHIQNCTPID